MRFDALLRGVLEQARDASTVTARIDLHEYALENLLLVQTADGPHVSRLGATFMQLRGRDAIRFLLILETTLCMADDDDHHVSHEVLQQALREGLTTSSADAHHPFSLWTISRLHGMGVLVEAYAARGYVVEPRVRDLVEEALVLGPWHAAIGALLADVRATLVPTLPVQPTATDATIEQSRMLAHEVRNALVPVRHHLDALLTAPPEPRRVEAARRGVVRVLDFVDQLVATAELIAEPLERCDLLMLLTSAHWRLDGNDRVDLDTPTTICFVTVPPQRFVVALTNLFHNALAFAAAPARVRASWHDAGDEVQIRVDDGGPGVPIANRTLVFSDGFTTRLGGSGFGLAYVRKLVETTLRGRVWCEDSDLGGARFVIAIPTRAP